MAKKRYEVLERSFLGGRLYHPGSFFVGDVGIPGKHLREVGGAVQASAPAGKQTSTAELFKAKHNGPGVGAGNWAVEKIEDGSRASVVFKKDDGDAKAKAEAEAARLNAGGEIDLGATDSAPSSAQEDLTAGTQTDDLPDA